LSEVGSRRIRRDPTSLNLGSFASAGIQQTSRRMIRRWFQAAGLAVQRDIPVVPERRERLRARMANLGDGILAEEFIFVGIKR